jgi:hypothetical protein
MHFHSFAEAEVERTLSKEGNLAGFMQTSSDL